MRSAPGPAWRLATVLAAALGTPGAGAVEVPAEGACPPYPVTAVTDAAPEPTDADAVPPVLVPGSVLDLEQVAPLSDYLPREVWMRREFFFHEGMRMEVGPCHRRYPAPEFFEGATRENRGRTRLDDAGNLVAYAGRGLPFPPDSIRDDAPDAGQRWAWNYRYRYMGAGFRGRFRIIELDPRRKRGERFEGSFAWVPLHGIPGLKGKRPDRYRFAAGGEFDRPEVARGVAWRQLGPSDADTDYRRSDDIFVWIPDQRKVRRAPPQSVDGLFMPSYTRGQLGDGTTLAGPGGAQRVPDSSLATIEHQRRGFEGLLLRPNAYRFHLIRVQDVLAPINSVRLGFPTDGSRSYGPTGLSLATDRWELRRAVVIQGERIESDGPVASVTLWIDVLTAQPLYLVSRRANRLIYEVGIFMGRYSADDPLQPRWTGNGDGFGVIQPVAAAFFVAGGGGWLRESFELRSDPPDAAEIRDLTTTVRLQQGR